MADNPLTVIYEVNLSVDADVIESFDEWLHQHMQEMLAIPGFISASTSLPDVSDENRKHRCVQYRLSDQASLDDYLEHHAERMRAKADLEFEGKYTASRRILSVAQAALAKHDACANCGAELSGRFCAVCGQREEPRVPSIGSVTSEFTNEVFVIESKLWRSFRTLIFRPGELTSVYLAGRRQLYMSPLRLYLLFSIMTFAYLSSINMELSIEESPNVEQAESLAVPTTEVEPEPNESIEFDSILFSEEVDDEIEQKLEGAVASIQSDIKDGKAKAVINKFLQPLPKALFLFLPFVALLFKILFLGSGRYYVEHLVYVLHNHAFLFSLILFTTVVTKVTRLWPQLETSVALGLTLTFFLYVYTRLRTFLLDKYSKSKVQATLFALLIVGLLVLQLRLSFLEGVGVPLGLLWNLYVPFYIYRSLRVVYQRSRWATIATFFTISLTYLVLLMIMVVSSIVFVGYSYS